MACKKSKSAPVKRMKEGGPTSQDMKRLGRNLARVANQRGGKK